MKKLNHENIVKLFEVINDESGKDDYIYLILEYVHKGAILSEQYINWEQKYGKTKKIIKVKDK